MDMISTIYVAQKLLASPKLILRSCSFCPLIVLGLVFFCPLLETFQLIHPLKIFHRHFCPLLVGGVPTNNWLKMYTGLFTFVNMPIMIINHRLMLVFLAVFYRSYVAGPTPILRSSYNLQLLNVRLTKPEEEQSCSKLLL